MDALNVSLLGNEIRMRHRPEALLKSDFEQRTHDGEQPWQADEELFSVFSANSKTTDHVFFLPMCEGSLCQGSKSTHFYTLVYFCAVNCNQDVFYLVDTDWQEDYASYQRTKRYTTASRIAEGLVRFRTGPDAHLPAGIKIVFLPVRQQQADDQRLACALYVPWVFLTLVRHMDCTSSTRFSKSTALVQEPIAGFLSWIHAVCSSYPTSTTPMNFGTLIPVENIVVYEESDLPSGNWRDEGVEKRHTPPVSPVSDGDQYEYNSNSDLPGFNSDDNDDGIF